MGTTITVPKQTGKQSKENRESSQKEGDWQSGVFQDRGNRSDASKTIDWNIIDLASRIQLKLKYNQLNK
ncbi:hypothetical protein [Christiangramia crocea]|uniref:Uncharacterized protein n=1 Tax=Christiangramia crocea TaxID=2904124 RepID=A0A9X1UVR0_9FLAO|nr:hypothetical protein [Gramella crocea]MCG9971031.1 hypothetical protein [Gramella crocea]